MKMNQFRKLIREEIKKNLFELDFKSDKAFKLYNKLHKIGSTTKVSIAGKQTTAGELTKSLGNKIGVTNSNKIPKYPKTGTPEHKKTVAKHFKTMKSEFGKNVKIKYKPQVKSQIGKSSIWGNDHHQLEGSLSDFGIPKLSDNSSGDTPDRARIKYVPKTGLLVVEPTNERGSGFGEFIFNDLELGKLKGPEEIKKHMNNPRAFLDKTEYINLGQSFASDKEFKKNNPGKKSAYTPAAKKLKNIDKNKFMH